MRRILFLILALVAMLLTLACGGTLWPAAVSNDGPYDPTVVIADAVKQRIGEEHGAIQTFTVLDVRQLVPDASPEFVIFYGFTTAATDAAPAREGWGYAVGMNQGAERFNVLQQKSVVSKTTPPFVGYDTDTYNNTLIVFGRTFSPDAQAVQLFFGGLQPQTAAATPQGGIGLLLAVPRNDTYALQTAEVLNAKKQVLARYDRSQLIDP